MNPDLRRDEGLFQGPTRTGEKVEFWKLSVENEVKMRVIEDSSGRRTKDDKLGGRVDNLKVCCKNGFGKLLRTNILFQFK